MPTLPVLCVCEKLDCGSAKGAKGVKKVNEPSGEVSLPDISLKGA